MAEDHRLCVVATKRHSARCSLAWNNWGAIGVLGSDNVQALERGSPCDAFASDVFTPDVFPPGAFSVVPRPARSASSACKGARTRSSSSDCAGEVHRELGTYLHRALRSRLRAAARHAHRARRQRPARVGAGEEAARWIARRAHRIRRIASVCTGVYGIAPSGLLDGRRVTTHWSAVRDVQRRFPKLHVDGDAVYLKDGSFYSSAGITAGIDLVLALIEEDCGRTPRSPSRARWWCTTSDPAGESVSEPLRFQFEAADRFADVAAWVQLHLRAQLSWRRLQKRACMSVRHFRASSRNASASLPPRSSRRCGWRRRAGGSLRSA